MNFLYNLIHKKFPSTSKYIDAINGLWTEFGVILKYRIYNKNLLEME